MLGEQLHERFVMDLVSFQGRVGWKLARSLFVLIALYGVLGVAVSAQPRSYVKVKLRISFKTDALPKNVEISIPREGLSRDGAQLKEIKATIENGKLSPDKTSPDFSLEDRVLVRPNTDFQLTGSSHKLIVKAEGFADIQSMELTDAALTSASLREDKVLPISVAFVAPNPSPSPSASPSPTPGGTSLSMHDWIKSMLSGVKNMFWVLGLFGFCAVGVWVSLALLAKFLKQDRVERWLLRLAPSLAQAVIRPFGFRLRHSLFHKTEFQSTSICLRNIDQSLVQLCEANTTENAQSRIQVITANLIRLVGLNGTEIYLEGITSSLGKLAGRPGSEGGETANAASLMSAVKEAMGEALGEFKLEVLKEFKSEVLNETQILPPRPAETVVTPPKISEPLQPKIDSTDRLRAKSLYQMLLDHQPLDCKPVYLEVDAKSSILGKLADANVYLLQVPSPQAPFVLFSDDRDDGTVGWVFPNTAQGFDRSTLKDVFPGLNEAQFNEAKGIEPVVVSKAGERRWKVGP